MYEPLLNDHLVLCNLVQMNDVTRLVRVVLMTLENGHISLEWIQVDHLLVFREPWEVHNAEDAFDLHQRIESIVWRLG